MRRLAGSHSAASLTHNLDQIALDGDGRDEIVVGLGPQRTAELFDDIAEGLRGMPQTDVANGATARSIPRVLSFTWNIITL
jgi:hypothetical protein